MHTHTNSSEHKQTFKNHEFIDDLGISNCLSKFHVDRVTFLTVFSLIFHFEKP